MTAQMSQSIPHAPAASARPAALTPRRAVARLLAAAGAKEAPC